MEFEKSLQNFFMHTHNHNNVDFILCWNVDEKELNSKIKSYLKTFTKYIKTIEYIKKSKENNFYNELLFNNCDGTNHTVKLYIISEIIEKLCDNLKK